MVVLLGWNSSREEVRVNVKEFDKAKAEAAAAAVGLRILIQQLSSQQQQQQQNSSSNIFLKSCNLLRFSGSGKSSFSTDNICCCDNEENYYKSSKYFTKYCCLYKKKLRGDKKVYMYKGDQGFYSVECRNRQIYLDDIADFEASTKKVLSSTSSSSSSFSHCSLDNGSSSIF